MVFTIPDTLTRTNQHSTLKCKIPLPGKKGLLPGKLNQMYQLYLNEGECALFLP